MKLTPLPILILLLFLLTPSSQTYYQECNDPAIDCLHLWNINKFSAQNLTVNEALKQFSIAKLSLFDGVEDWQHGTGITQFYPVSNPVAKSECPSRTIKRVAYHTNRNLNGAGEFRIFANKFLDKLGSCSTSERFEHGFGCSYSLKLRLIWCAYCFNVPTPAC